MGKRIIWTLAVVLMLAGSALAFAGGGKEGGAAATGDKPMSGWTSAICRDPWWMPCASPGRSISRPRWRRRAAR